MFQMYSNATVAWTEAEIEHREYLIRRIYRCLHDAWTGVNPAVKFRRVETPILTPAATLATHDAAGFGLIDALPFTYLRPETTAGTYAAFCHDYPQTAQRIEITPMCYWQAGKSFRNEKKGDTMRATKLRLREFWQLEFQLFLRPDTQQDYKTLTENTLLNIFGGTVQQVDVNELPHYSYSTADWHIETLEVAGLSLRKDFPDLDVFEVALGLDRLVALNVR